MKNIQSLLFLKMIVIQQHFLYLSGENETKDKAHLIVLVEHLFPISPILQKAKQAILEADMKTLPDPRSKIATLGTPHSTVHNCPAVFVSCYCVC